ncbi:MAG: Crp/Fnr family transcriptional regulator [Proteobacteria bacterium]|jgi:hypothetical protein|nr:Crp/Fnr family transcriptional regulator [Pseudomonadota bacterium]MBS1171667.1 Crp/Fnr family transcriptional regulator [Pseudomonadota bacterium]
MSRDNERLLRLLERLGPEARRSLFDFAEFLASRVPAPRSAPQVAPRAPGETVIQAIRRLNRAYPALKRHRLMPQVERLLAQHMMDNRPAAEVIDELEACFAAEYRVAEGD